MTTIGIKSLKGLAKKGKLEDLINFTNKSNESSKHYIIRIFTKEAIKNNNIEVINFILNHQEYKYYILDSIVKYAVLANNVNVLNFLYVKGMFYYSKNIFFLAVKNGFIESILFLYDNGFTFDKNICDVASTFGQFECLKALFYLGFKCNENTFKCAAQNGNIDCVKFLHEINCPFDPNICYVESEAIINWARNNNIIFTRSRASTLDSGHSYDTGSIEGTLEFNN
jgi:hypothetical protein